MSLIVRLMNPRPRWLRFATRIIRYTAVRSVSFVERRIEAGTFRLRTKSNSGLGPVCLFLSLRPNVMRKSRIALS